MGIFDKFKDHDDKEEKKAKADFSGVKSGGSSTADAAEKQVAPEAGASTYTVEAGDSLWKISEKFYGDGNQWRRIYEANKAEIKDPDVIHPGQTFTIPVTEGEGR